MITRNNSNNNNYDNNNSCIVTTMGEKSNFLPSFLPCQEKVNEK